VDLLDLPGRSRPEVDDELWATVERIRRKKSRGGGSVLGQVRECPACTHPHAVGTTCRECPECRSSDPVLQAEATFSDLMPVGAEAQAALARHNASLRLHAMCDGGCGVPDCRKPYFDDAGLTRYRSDDQEIRKES